jgi:hypothetical protein
MDCLRISFRIALVFEAEIPHLREHAENSVFSLIGRHIHHDAVPRVVIADVDLDALPAAVIGCHQVIKDIVVDQLGLGRAGEVEARLASRPEMAFVGTASAGQSRVRGR